MSRVFRVNKCPTEILAFSNCLIVSPLDFDPQYKYVLLNNEFIFNIRQDQAISPGEIGPNTFQRKWANLSLNQEVGLSLLDPFKSGEPIFAYSITFELSTHRKNQQVAEVLDSADLAKTVLNNFVNQIFTTGQYILLEFHGINFTLTPTSCEVMHLESLQSLIRLENKEAKSFSSKFALLVAQSNVYFTKASDAQLKLKGDAKKAAMNPIIQPSFKFEDMGIGGLDKEFSAIFRRAFASRIFPPSIVEKLGIQHVKGILLYGPPGTGKTLMARQIAKMLNTREPLIVNGPEVLNKFVGQSEENIRKLFHAAEQEYKEKGDESGLHIIIFDELDAICKQRGSKNDGTGVGDSIVNQLLSKMDGVEQLNNILVIGMTNRLDMIDEALLRPGRLELKLEISLPDEQGRLQIFKIHTHKMQVNNMLHSDVDLQELSALSKNFSGAEISGLVKSATSFAFNRHIKVGGDSIGTDMQSVKLERADFLRALDEVQAAFGANENELSQCVTNGIIPFGVTSSILASGALFIKQVKMSNKTPLVSVLLHGPPGAGKTALAATMAMSSDFPFIKLISPESMVGYSESAKAAQIAKVFQDSYKSPLSVIVVDNIERLLEWVPLGPRLSNVVLQTLLVLLKKQPPAGKKLLILCTATSRSVLQQLDMADCFNAELYVPNLMNIENIALVTHTLTLFSNRDQTWIYQLIHSKLKISSSNSLLSAGVPLSPSIIEDTTNISISVKQLLMIIEMARQDDVPEEKFIDTLSSYCRI
ncbi:transport between ER and Golgi ATPase protein [Coelomomyces lativittatus]|nr:transport between ER and Golgi ATPase protein [Coelomomyces lativittatus]KAJ1510240.1 transport between ER and Golgi ATPase protein [Coelomomyces lativittatus]KAJ1515666.1 transport between ER and Golgi ATPase protein [Coelomomyces lativittatus]